MKKLKKILAREEAQKIRDVAEKEAQKIRDVAEKIRLDDRADRDSARLQADKLLQARLDDMANKADKLQLDTTREKNDKIAKDNKEAAKLPNRLQKAQAATKGMLTDMPKKATDLPAYFEQVERTFQRLEIAEDLQLLILQKYFSDESKKLIAEHVQSTDYQEVKAIILRANKLS